MGLSPKVKDTLFGLGGGVFTATYSNAVRHRPILNRFPTLHISCIAVGGLLGYALGVYEEGALKRHESFLEKYRAERNVIES
eukprot:CFRG1567T1